MNLTAPLWLAPLLAALALSVTAVAPSPAAAMAACGPSADAIATALCRDARLASLDQKVAATLDIDLGLLDRADRQALEANQAAWLKGRETACPPTDDFDNAFDTCLGGLYFTRQADLQNLAKSPRTILANLLWTTGVACRGDRALIRFGYTVPDDDTTGTSPPPAIGGELGRASVSGNECRLDDGRVVRFKTASMDDEADRGMCGGEASEIYSVWIGDAKVVSREQRAGKCQSNPVRAIYLDGRRLTRCAEGRGVVASEAADGTTCDDLSQRLARPARETNPENSFLVTWSAPGQQAFCQGMIRALTPDHSGMGEPFIGDADWPQKTALPTDGLGSDKPVLAVDLDNSGEARVAIPGEYFDSYYWARPPRGMSLAEAGKRTDAVRDDAAIVRLRQAGFEVFTGDQTPYEDSRDVYLVPFVKDGKTWLWAKSDFNALDRPTEVITRPTPRGAQETVCRYQATPDL